jgi:hypothetical protein
LILLPIPNAEFSCVVHEVELAAGNLEHPEWTPKTLLGMNIVFCSKPLTIAVGRAGSVTPTHPRLAKGLAGEVISLIL